MDKTQLEVLVREILTEKLSAASVRSFRTDISFTEADRLDTGDASHRVYTHDFFSLSHSPRLGVGMMQIEKSTFPWTLHYDEVDYVLEGTLIIRTEHGEVTAHPGEGILIPRGSSIHFSAPNFARFLYVTYPADWKK